MNVNDYAFEVSAAGRVNIIGEHIDYCGGKVMPAALSLKNTVYVRPNGTNFINIQWATIPNKVSLDINNLQSYRSLPYGNYIAGCAVEWLKDGHKVLGCDMYQHCTVPFGSGLSSSAAIEVSTIAAFAAIAGESIDPVGVALAAQRAEQNYAGVNCGIMDQYASACGKSGMAMLLDCKTLNCTYLPLDLGDYSLIIMDCNKPHSLSDSKYNERRQQTEQALAILQTRLDISCLADVTPAQFEEHKHLLPQPIRDRCCHVVYECRRVRLAEEAMRRGDISALGGLLNQSHSSLSKLYQTTGDIPDALVQAAMEHPACIGSRLTGGGFGGCTISLVHTPQVEQFIGQVTERYARATGCTAKVYRCHIADGITVKRCR